MTVCLSDCGDIIAPERMKLFQLAFFVLKGTYVRVFLDMYDGNRLSPLRVARVQKGKNNRISANILEWGSQMKVHYIIICSMKIA